MKNTPSPLSKILNTLLVLFFLSPPLLQATELLSEPPDLGSSDLIEYNVILEKELGRAFSTALHTYYDLNYDPDVITYIRKIGHEISSKIGAQRPFRFYVIDNPSINAFAGPNGVIGIHTGLILAVKDEAELAAVIAHEIAHVTQQHLSRAHELNSKQSNLTSIATLLAAILIGMHDSSAVMPTLMAGMSLNIEQQLKNSRLYESEADNAGIKFLSQAGYNPHAMGDFFARLAKENQNNEFKIPEILRSHPVTNNRIVEAEHRAQSLLPKQPKEINNHLTLIQLKLKNASKHDHKTPFALNKLAPVERCYQTNLSALSPNTQRPSNQTLQCLEKLVKNHPNHTFYTTLWLNTLSKAPLNNPKKMTKALSQAEYLLALYPDNTAILLAYVELLLSLNKPQKAIKQLTQYIADKKYKYLSYKKLSEIYANQRQKPEAYYYLALAQFDIGNIKRTNYLLTQAQTLLNQTKKETNESLKQQIMLFKHKNSTLLNSKIEH